MRITTSNRYRSEEGSWGVWLIVLVAVAANPILTHRPTDGQNLFKWPTTSLQYNIPPHHYTFPYQHPTLRVCWPTMLHIGSTQHYTRQTPYISCHAPNDLAFYKDFGVHIWEGPHCNYGTAPRPKTFCPKTKPLSGPFKKLTIILVT